MIVYVAPPRGKLEKIAYQQWFENYGHEPIWLDLRRKVKGPLILCGGAVYCSGTLGHRDCGHLVRITWLSNDADSGSAGHHHSDRPCAYRAGRA